MDDANAVMTELAAIPDALDRVKRAGEIIEELQATQDEAVRIRREGLEELLKAGYRRSELATELGVGQTRIGQLLASTSFGPERRFLDSGPMTVVIGGKHAAEKPEPVMSADAFAAWETMRDLATRYSREAVSEVIPPPGSVRLNRPGLVVVCSPRLLPAIGKVIETSSPYRFSSDSGGWFMVDSTTDTTHRSPMDSGGEEDFAFVGRLPRPDGRGYFLHVGGIHGPGTRGAAQWLASNVRELWRTVKAGPFSVMLRVSFDSGTNEPLQVEKLTDIYTPEA